MIQQKSSKKISLMFYLRLLLMGAISLQLGCATNNYSGKIAGGMLIGAGVGAAAGSALSSGGDSKERTKNTIISSIIFSLLAGGAMSWHYQQMEQEKVEISGRFARYRLCDPADSAALSKELEFGNNGDAAAFPIKESQLGKLALSLDDNTKWVYPNFRKRFLQPERNENQVISERYIWEIIKPGSFVTRSQNPEYFFEPYKK